MCLRLNGRRKQLAVKPLRPQLDEDTKPLFKEELAKHLSENNSCTHPEEARQNIQSAVDIAVKAVNNLKPKVSEGQ